MKFVCSGYQWPSFLWLIFLGTASVLPSSYQGVPMLAAILAIYCWGYPTLPFPWRGTCSGTGIPYEEYVYDCHCQIYTKKKKKKCTQLQALFAFDRVTFSVSSIPQGKEIEAWRKKHTYVKTTIISRLSHLFSLSLCCFVRLTIRNKFLKQKARSEDPWGVYIVRSAAWASHKPLFSKTGGYCRNFFKSKILYPHHKWSWGTKIQTGGGNKLSVPGAIHPRVCNSAEATLLSPILIKAGLGITAIPA